MSARINGFSPYFRGPESHTAIPGVLMGIVFHLAVARTIEVEEFLYSVLGVLLLALGGVASAYAFLGFSPLDVFTRTCVVASSFNTGLLCSMIIYRLFFHRLRKFPGPIDLKISRFFSALRASKELMYYKELIKLHEEYGDFIRTGPRELCIVRKSAIQTIYGPNSKCSKSTWYIQQDIEPELVSLQNVRSHDQHRRRRKAWDRGFAIKALHSYEPRIKALVDDFVSNVPKQVPVDSTAWSMYLLFDIMGAVGFGKDFGCVSTGSEHEAIKAIHDYMNVIGILSHIPWLLNLLAHVPESASGYASFFEYCDLHVQAKWRNFNKDQEPQDIMSWLLKAVVEKDSSASPTDKSLSGDARLLIVAGSETTATTLAATLFYLAKYPTVFKKLQSQVDAVMPNPADWTYEKAKSITYLDNIIEEALRLKPAVPTGVYRVTPAEGIQVDEQFIPGNTNVFVPVYAMQTDERYWKRGLEFIPERFGEQRAEMGTEGAPYLPFSIGPYGCAGKNLAMMSLRIALSRIVQHFDVALAPGETGEAFDKEAKDTFTIFLKPVMLEFSPRN
ncbi:putative benzoate 4-monooxygenase cytochrome P450 [Hypoxylon sp. NC1633]|nr:putative benzoate 4-monooxygenase cytochrome P450 [Hypoxylon sp. NC1633]